MQLSERPDQGGLKKYISDWSTHCFEYRLLALVSKHIVRTRMLFIEMHVIPKCVVYGLEFFNFLSVH
jgi:hypothetical protein